MQARQRAEAERARIARRRPLVEQRARELADLPDDEFAAEVARVFRAKRQRRPA
jgi:hypothetical protein